MFHLRRQIVAGLFLYTLSLTLVAGEYALCKVPVFELNQAQEGTFSGTEIGADQLLQTGTDLIRFSGQVQFQRGQQTINADQITLDKTSERVEAEGQVLFEDPGYRLQTERLSLNQDQQSANFDAASFQLPGRHLSGSADSIEKFDDARSRFTNLLYTSCDPQDRDWHLTANQLDIDQETGRGVARGATLYFQNIPFFYLPYFIFPIDDRRMSGMLTPSFGYSQAQGSAIALPVYWNIAPNLDATITPAWYDDHGLQLNLEQRYLFAANQGQFDFSYLDDSATNQERWLQKWQHRIDPGWNLSGDLLLQQVSDDDYFEDFDRIGSLKTNPDHLERHLRLERTTESWESRILWQDYRTLNTTIAAADRPYQRLPQISLQSRFDTLENGLQFNFGSEWVQFERDSSVTGSRLHVNPGLSWLSSDSWYFLRPELQAALSDYQLDNNPGDNNIQRSLPIFSLDSGLIFDRTIASRPNWTQTLEPRLYFLHTPYRDQDAIPDFDTAELTESYGNFFKPNRFSGVDRIGDANQLTLGIASRLLDRQTGSELLHARLAQVYYFEDRRVSLDSTIDSNTKSSLVAELDLNPTSNLKISSKLAYQPTTNALSQKTLSINYSNSAFAANAAYYFVDQELEQSSLSTVYPLNSRWTLVAKYHESLLHNKPVENLFGVNYESCCWGLKILASQTSDDDFIETDRAIYVEFTLKGLTQAGTDIDAQLSRAIPGYQPRF